MNTNENNKLTMFNTTNLVLAKFNDVLGPLPNYPGIYQHFNGNVVKINVFSEEKKLKRTGYVKEKELVKQNLVTLVLDTSKKIKAWALFENKLVLLDEISVSASKLKRTNEEGICEYAQGIHKRAGELLASLESYGINAGTQAALQAALDSYKAALPQKRMATVTDKDNTRQMKLAFKNADADLAKIDALVEIISLTAPDCYNQYKSARKIIQLGKSSMALKLIVVEAGTSEPVKNATATFKPNSNGDNPGLNGSITIVKKTSLKGGLYLKTLAEGSYTLTVKKSGYTDKEQQIIISKGELNRVMVELEKV